MNPILKKTLNLIYSSRRPMPAHFTSDGDRKQSFCIDFELLDADADYDLAATSWAMLGEHVKGSEERTQQHINAALLCGENLTVGAFIITKLDRPDLIEEMRKVVTMFAIQDLSKTTEHPAEMFLDEDVEGYFNYCSNYGRSRASSSRLV